MPVIVTVEMYSGLPNPSWELSDADATKLRALLSKPRPISPQASPGSLGRLGYRGLLVRDTSAAVVGPQGMRVFDGLLEAASLATPNVIDHDSEVEEFLLGTASGALRQEEVDYARQEIEKNARGGPAGTSEGFEPMVEPAFDPGKWNDNAFIRMNNNCYNYANDKITNTFAQPGRANGYTLPMPLTCPGVREGAVVDGLAPLANPNVSPAQGQVVALVIAVTPFNDYHWYRRDINGKWSHKPGQTPATNRDNSGRAIDDPSICDRGAYANFCGFFLAVPSLTRIR